MTTAVIIISLLASVMSVTAQTGMCRMCESGSPANTELIIPFLAIGTNTNPTCLQVADYGFDQIPESDEVCNVIKSHKDFCGCPEGSSAPLNNCSLCPDGSQPTNLSSETPFEDTCSELDTYLRYLPADLCATERAASMRRADVFCGCPGATADCYMCSDGTNDLANPDRLVPFFAFLGNSFSATCRELADFYTLYDIDDPDFTTCEFVQMESRYCGCQAETETSPVNSCNLCPNGAASVQSSKFIHELGMTCSQLETYLSFVPADQCSMPWVVDLQRFDYFCGCTAATAECPICPDGSTDVANPDLIIPYFIVADNENPTCQQLATLSVITRPGELAAGNCTMLTSQAAFCGCPNTAKPSTGCDFCPGGTAPPNPDLVTPFGDTCEELSDYLSYLSPDQCNSNRVGFIQRQDFLCGCAAATTACALCSADGSNDISFRERHVPLLSLPLNANPTCQEVVEFMAVNDGALSTGGCNALQSYQGYCGCPAVLARNECSFCPNGGTPATPDMIVSDIFTCQDLQDFVSFLTADTCQADNPDFVQIQAFAYVCGCPNVQPACTLCPNGAPPLQADKLLADGETRCNEFASLVETLTPDQCSRQASTLEAARSQCGCRSGGSSSSGLCGVEQNLHLCTTELLDTVSEQCECYAFCDSTFVKCEDQGGGLLTTSECPGTPITGCNRASASMSGGGTSTGSGSSSSSSSSSGGGGGGNDNTLTIALAVAIPAGIALLVTIYYFFTRKSQSSNDKLAANLEAEQESDALPYGEGSLSMSDVPIPPPSSPAPPASSFSSIESPISMDPDNKVV
ncbi:hypothetical protein IV203_008447 [Nitzschia inconspicua]|uniref:Uncharacterized protein n=1 Tax=Nitzschia inconspicua TaxID=303405 RepID=A0A9K3KYJ3_9STRA|nr:hypothetical protein IV203_008447 [Nitzschia inconspicua]